MEHTTFEVEEAAEIMNEHFINIKVDREERPDVDKVYMNYVLLTTGHGGWPMSVFLEPNDLAPIFGGTYFSAHGEGRRPGFIKICQSVALQWRTNKEKILASSESIARHLKAKTTEPVSSSLREDFLETLEQYLLIGVDKRSRSFDSTFGGWGSQPKFPQPVIMTAHLAAHYVTEKSPGGADVIEVEGSKRAKNGGNFEYLEQVQVTLRHMYAAGIHDHLGGGFHRYGVTDDWKLPHFEKMLYDQSQIANAYLATYQLTLASANTGDFEADEATKRSAKVFRDAAEDIFRYVNTQVSDASTGAFYSAEDADSPLASDTSVKKEGAFYVWHYDELKQILEDREFILVTRLYDILKSGNVPPEYDPHHELTNMNILHAAPGALEELAPLVKMSVAEARDVLAASHAKMREAQAKRPRPHLDDKCVTAWNAMMIGSLAKGYQVLRDPKLLERALASLNFIKNNLYNPERKQLLRSYRLGPSNIDGFADDYAYLISALLDLYEATFDVSHLQLAVELQETMDDLFWDKEDGAYFQDNGNPELHLLTRTKEEHDGSEPSYNSVAAHSLTRLYHMLEDMKYKSRAEDLFAAFATHLSKIPAALPMMTVAAAAFSRPPKVILIYGDLADAATQALIAEVHQTFDPFRVVIQASKGSEAAQFFHKQGLDTFKSLDDDLSDSGAPAARICENFSCGLPITKPAELKSRL